MFQQQVYVNPGLAVPGDFASSNPMDFKLSSTGRMVADSAGVTVGKFAILNNGTTTTGTVTSLPDAAVNPVLIGFVHREMNAQITTYLAEAGNTIQPGNPVALFRSGDFYVNADVITGTPVNGAQIWWDTITGNTIVGAPGSPPSTTVQTLFYLASDSAVVGQTVMITDRA